MTGGRKQGAGILLFFGSLCFFAAAFSQTLPPYGEALHLGVASCASSMCHGAAGAREGSDVLQNEYLIWQRHDAHARGYATLRTPAARRIAEQLGLGPATEAKLCLDCHADHPPPERRGPGFLLSDGIGCEACHGGAERWLSSHAAPETRRDELLAEGLYPTADPAARAALCLSCHRGRPDKPLLHRVYAAGHPPLLFELDTYMANLPPHHRPDVDYRARKPVHSPLAWWAQGQIAAALATLRDLELHGSVTTAGFPEFALYECGGCHHTIDPARTVRGQAGLPRLADIHLQLAGLILAADRPEAAAAWQRELAALQTETGRETARAALRDRLLALPENSLRHWPPARAERLQTLLLEAGGALAGDFDAARQLVMALAVIRDSLGRPEAGRLEPLYAAVAERQAYSSGRLEAALNEYKSF